jgi:Protein of unknown function (DUF3800)
MQIAFFDEFGHCGPVISRTDARHKTSPVFGLAGIVLPAIEVRAFVTCFFQLKNNMLSSELHASGAHPATWEKKGSELISSKNINTYAHVRQGVSRFLNEIYKRNGRIIYYGREKYQKPEESNSNGLYNTALSHTIRNTDKYCQTLRSPFIMILDQHPNRIKLLAQASKTMFGADPARCLLEPPFQVESHLYQTVQAADWIAALIGRIEAFRASPIEFQDWQWAEQMYGEKLRRLTTHSTIWKPPRRAPVVTAAAPAP